MFFLASLSSALPRVFCLSKENEPKKRTLFKDLILRGDSRPKVEQYEVNVRWTFGKKQYLTATGSPPFNFKCFIQALNVDRSPSRFSLDFLSLLYQDKSDTIKPCYKITENHFRLYPFNLTIFNLHLTIFDLYQEIFDLHRKIFDYHQKRLILNLINKRSTPQGLEVRELQFANNPNKKPLTLL